LETNKPNEDANEVGYFSSFTSQKKLMKIHAFFKLFPL